MPRNSLPSDKTILEQSLIAEAIRLCLWRNEGNAHILALRSWVTRKLRSLLPSIEQVQEDQDIFYKTLKNMIFLGDILSLSNGYYNAAPTRCVPIKENRMALISGLPTHYFWKNHIPIEIQTTGRHITEYNSSYGLQIQPRDSYIGFYGLTSIDQDFIEKTIMKTPSEMFPGKWNCYQGNKGYDFDWKPLEHPVASRFGILSFWQLSDGMGDERYHLQVTKQNHSTLYSVPCRLYKQICLWIDKLEGKQRVIYLTPKTEGMILKMNFIPTEAGMRWLYASGSTWLKYESGHVYWLIPFDSINGTKDIFSRLPVIIEQR